jgi:hypothetical protein
VAELASHGGLNSSPVVNLFPSEDAARESTNPSCFNRIRAASRSACNAAAKLSWDHGQEGVQRGRMTFLPEELYAELGAEAGLGVQDVGWLAAARCGRFVRTAVGMKPVFGRPSAVP